MKKKIKKRFYIISVLIPIIFLALTAQLYLFENLFSNQSGGSIEINGYNPSTAGAAVNLPGENYNAPVRETIQIRVPDFQAELKHMGKINRTNHILYPEDANTYIMPENDVVKWYANNTILTDDTLVWKHNNSAVMFQYETDNNLFNNPQDGDMWQNPDYYLANGAIGDCEDFSLAFASILEAKGISTEIIGVTLINNNNHWIVKYSYNDLINYADINRNSVIIWHNSNPTIYKIWVSIDRKAVHKIKQI
jgi:hypothetical protein